MEKIGGIDSIKETLRAMDEYKSYVRDDFQRFGYDNFESGIRFACCKLGVSLEDEDESCLSSEHL